MVRTTAAILAGKVVRALARRRGGGSAFPGLVAERIDPRLLAHTLADLPGGIVVVSGTNGKTTTTKMLAAIVRAHGLRVFTNPTGSNFTRGVVSSMLGVIGLSGRLAADIAVLELDEWHALHFIKVVTPTHALLLNVARDQLDRFAEIDTTADLLATLAKQTSSTVVLNRDDSFIARIAESLAVPAATSGASDAPIGPVQIHYFGVDPAVSDTVPALQEADVRFTGDLTVPPPTSRDGLLHPQDARAFAIRFGDEHVGPVRLHQRGLAAMINATAATTMARAVLGEDFRPATALEALHAVRPPFGRGEIIEIDGAPLELVLVKNPAGFTVALSTYGNDPAATMIAINDDYADGQDVSWLYDVSFTSLHDPGVAVTSGVRAFDMALRLEYDDVAVAAIEPDLDTALDHFLAGYPAQPKRIFCTYTAMMSLRRTLAARYDLPQFGEEPA